jgi:hypothetical protein
MRQNALLLERKPARTAIETGNTGRVAVSLRISDGALTELRLT